jgi:pectinesterase inhibitor-like protein
MAHLSRSLLLIILFALLFISCTAEPAFAQRSRSRAYIKASCRATRYPALCVQCLFGYADNATIQSPEQLAQIALSVSLYRAWHTRAYMLEVEKALEASKAKDYQAVKDCLAQISDSVNQLSQSIRELRRLGHEPVGDNFFWHISNVEAWISAALSDASFCFNELPGRNIGKLKATIKGKVLNVAQTTSNALALFHQYAAKYKAARVAKKP